MSSVITQAIKGTDCIGDSRLTINLNFSALDLSVQELSSNLTTLSTTSFETQTDLLTLSTIVQTGLTDWNTAYQNASANLVYSDVLAVSATLNPDISAVTNIVVLTQGAYDSIITPHPTTIYYIISA
jgi:hypothetical protein